MIPSAWCSHKCADANFQAHREQIHMPHRRKNNNIVLDREQLEYFSAPGSAATSLKTNYRAKDISAHVITYLEASKQWEEENHVKLKNW